MSAKLVVFLKELELLQPDPVEALALDLPRKVDVVQTLGILGRQRLSFPADSADGSPTCLGPGHWGSVVGRWNDRDGGETLAMCHNFDPIRASGPTLEYSAPWGHTYYRAWFLASFSGFGGSHDVRGKNSRRCQDESRGRSSYDARWLLATAFVSLACFFLLNHEQPQPRGECTLHQSCGQTKPDQRLSRTMDSSEFFS